MTSDMTCKENNVSGQMAGYTDKRITKILIANRGEIACRIIRSAREKGIATVAVYSQADAGALHVAMADEAVEIGAAPVGESYLRGQVIIEAAQKTGAGAIHPGYGFLSENAGFAQAVAEAGLIFIGPSPEAISAMGDKAESKRRMIAAGVPCVPGYQGEDQNETRLLDEARAIGFPVMIKASAGGGGRGMRLVHEEAGFLQLLRLAKSEALNAFGDDRMLIEKAVLRPRHIEIQVFGDHHGNVIHLAERDCSIQRRHQKVVEEAPSPAITPAIRAAMGEAAVTAAKALSYVSAGTVEFLLDSDGNFYFLEMNTRLQVEHPVTEMVTGTDLVAMQIAVAEGAALPLTQEDVVIAGHAIEIRLYAEDPAQNFMPQTGRVTSWQLPEGPGVRVDHGIVEGAEVSAFYDPMLAKIICWGENREQARRRLVRAIADTRLFGVSTNRAFLLQTLEAPAFVDGEATTAFIEETFPDGYAPPAESGLPLGALAAAWFCRAGRWSSSDWAQSRLRLAVAEAQPEWFTVEGGEEALTVTDAQGACHTIRIISDQDGMLRYLSDGVLRSVPMHSQEDEIVFEVEALQYRVRDLTMSPPDVEDDATASGLVPAPITGTVISVEIAEGDRVERGQVLATLEAMKMQHMVLAPVSGLVETLTTSAGAQISARDLIVEIVEE